MKRISEELQRYPNMENVVFCQEESMNGGFWNYVQPRLQRALDPLGLKVRICVEILCELSEFDLTSLLTFRFQGCFDERKLLKRMIVVVHEP